VKKTTKRTAPTPAPATTTVTAKPSWKGWTLPRKVAALGGCQDKCVPRVQKWLNDGTLKPLVADACLERCGVP
jgi:hypothetical protein